jgi:hypothetical protein
MLRTPGRGLWWLQTPTAGSIVPVSHAGIQLMLRCWLHILFLSWLQGLLSRLGQDLQSLNDQVHECDGSVALCVLALGDQRASELVEEE